MNTSVNPRCGKCGEECVGSFIHLDGALYHSRCVFDASLLADLEHMRAVLAARDRRIAELEAALQPFANLRVEARDAIDGPDLPISVAVGRNKAVTAAIPLGVYDNVIPSRYVYAARRALATPPTKDEDE